MKNRLALNPAACVKLGAATKVSAVMHPSQYDVCEEIALVNTSERGELPHDFSEVPASRVMRELFRD